MSKELVIDVTSSEIFIALLEDNKLVELSKEKSNKKFTVGDIYLGKVKKIMSGLNAAFVDIGYGRDAFLHYLDLGPQFQSQQGYLKFSLQSNTNFSSIQNFKLKPDIDKNGQIENVLKSGQEVIVQIAKEPISTKGPRISSEISIAGRNLVLIPFSNKVSISQKIKSSEEKNRLKKLIQSIKPQNYGVIVRTVARNRRVAVLDTELRMLVEKWESAFKKLSNIAPPYLVIDELNRTTAILRDVLNKDFNSIYINKLEVYNEIKEYISEIAPEKHKIVKKYVGKTPIYEFFGIDKQIKALFGKTVTIRSGAYLIIEHTEALHVIDVNSGNRAKKVSNQETNAVEVNLVSAQEIARQIRLRDMGGIIVVDFIDMHMIEHKRMIYEKMKEAMSKDRSRHNILPLSKFGLMQITRQRVRPEMTIKTKESCPACKGTGEITPSILFIDTIENNLSYVISKFKNSTIILKLHPYILAYLKQGIFSIRLKWCLNFKKVILLKSVKTYSLLEYHFFDKRGVIIEF